MEAERLDIYRSAVATVFPRKLCAFTILPPTCISPRIVAADPDISSIWAAIVVVERDCRLLVCTFDDAFIDWRFNCIPPKVPFTAAMLLVPR